uniref:Uncharacterized protein n=1 Tax=Tanacetum cinerariifolium TaxID=118510 RepID=A0A699IM83_TANCI|nr:hypothetical protein [Tanacetum cinerariifolium]
MPNVDIPQGIETGGSPRRQETIRDTVPTPHNSPLPGGYIPGSNEGRIIEEMDKNEDVSLISEQGEVQETAEPSRDDDDDTTLAKTLLNLKRSATKDKGKEIMQETELPRKLKKKEMIQLSLDNRPFLKAKVRKNIIMYLKNQGGYKQSYFKGMKYEDIRPLFKRVWDQVHTFVPKDFEIKREVIKRAGFDLQQGISKKQRLDQQTKETDEEARAQGDSDQEVEELKIYMRIILEEDIAIETITLATKPSVIIEEDLETLWNLVKDKCGNTRPEEGYERVLWGDLKVMFKPDIESEISAVSEEVKKID